MTLSPTGIKINPAPFDPNRFFETDIWMSVAEEDQRALAITEISQDTIAFINFPTNPRHESIRLISPSEKLKALKETGEIRMSAAMGEALWNDYQEHGSESILEKIREEKGITSFDLLGTSFKNAQNRPHSLVLWYNKYESQWKRSVKCMDSNWNAAGYSGVVRR